MTKIIVYLQKSDKKDKKYKVTIPSDTGKSKTIYFGAAGYSDYTKHKDEDRMKLYNTRHRTRENWSKSGIKTAGFWSRWILWNKPSLLASIKDGRYEEQSYRLIHASDFPSHSIYYLLEGMFSQLKNPAEKSIILSATTSLSFFKGFSIYRTATIQETAEWVLHMADKIEREFGKGKIPYYLYHRTFEQETQQNSSLSNEQIEREENTGEGKENKEEKDELPPPPKAAPYCSVVKKVKKENITPENIGEIVLCQIPGISSATASVVMNKFKGKLPDLLDALRKDSTCLENLTMESGRKINKSTADNIQKYLC
jgi:ERCC4-type nuclease